jgi:large subunit ribosomal protein L25
MESTEKITLQATPRTVFGKSVRKIRKDGTIPGNIFGKDFKSQAITMNPKAFSAAYKQAGETGLMYIELEGKSIPALLSDIQYHPSRDSIIHVDLRKVNLSIKTEASVPVKFIGESVAVTQKNGILITQLDHILVKALPADIPHDIEVDLSVLTETGNEIKVSALPKSADYEILDDPERTIVSVTEHVEQVIEVQTTTEAPEILTAKPDEEGAEGAEAGAAPAAEPAKDDKGGKGRGDK